MVSYTNAQFSKNSNKIMQSKYLNMNTKNLIKLMPLIVVDHSPLSTSDRVYYEDSKQIYRLSIEGAASRHLIIP